MIFLTYFDGIHVQIVVKIIKLQGNVWEAINFAGFYKLDNLCAIIDVNRLGNFWAIFYHYIFEMNFLIANLSLLIFFNLALE